MTTTPLTNFQKVIEFHRCFGHPYHTSPQTDALDDNKLVKFRQALIEEEKNEFYEACENMDYVEAVDALADLLVVTYGTAVVFGVNLDEETSACLHLNELYQPNDTLFEKIKKYRNFYGFAVNSTPVKTIFDTDDYVVKQSALNNLYIDFVYNCEQKDFSEVVKNLANIIIVTYELGCIFGVNMDEVFAEVHRSNMTKLCTSEQEAQETVEWYRKNEHRYKNPAYKTQDKYWVVYDADTTKILKSIRYESPKLAEMLN